MIIVRTLNLTLSEVNMSQSPRCLWQFCSSGKFSSQSADVNKGCREMLLKSRVRSFQSWTYLVFLQFPLQSGIQRLLVLKFRVDRINFHIPPAREGLISKGKVPRVDQ